MSWIDKLRKGLSEAKDASFKAETKGRGRTRTARRTTRINRVERASSPKVAHPFRAVVIHSTEGCCDAAHRNSNQKFLALHAPQLPLGTCDRPQNCRCRYKHLTDRRQDMRRDEDHGLPGQPYYGQNRRYRKNRRRPEPLSA